MARGAQTLTMTGAARHRPRAATGHVQRRDLTRAITVHCTHDGRLFTAPRGVAPGERWGDTVPVFSVDDHAAFAQLMLLVGEELDHGRGHRYRWPDFRGPRDLECVYLALRALAAGRGPLGFIDAEHEALDRARILHGLFATDPEHAPSRTRRSVAQIAADAGVMKAWAVRIGADPRQRIIASTTSLSL